MVRSQQHCLHAASPVHLCSHLVEAQEVLDGGGGVEDVSLGRHNQHKAVQGLQTKNKKNNSFTSCSFTVFMMLPPGFKVFYLEQQVALREVDPIDGGHLGGEAGARADGGGSRWSQRVGDVSPEHQAPLAGPAGAILVFLHGSCRRRRPCLIFDLEIEIYSTFSRCVFFFFLVSSITRKTGSATNLRNNFYFPLASENIWLHLNLRLCVEILKKQEKWEEEKEEEQQHLCLRLSGWSRLMFPVVLQHCCSALPPRAALITAEKITTLKISSQGGSRWMWEEDNS